MSSEPEPRNEPPLPEHVGLTLDRWRAETAGLVERTSAVRTAWDQAQDVLKAWGRVAGFLSETMVTQLPSHGSGATTSIG